MSASPERQLRQEDGQSLAARVEDVVRSDLAPLVRRIDEGHYPERVLRSLGDAGAFSAHAGEEADLSGAIDAMARVARHCLATAFCMWCQDTFVWYVRN